MTRKKIVNMTSRKKRDTMMVQTNTTSSTPAGGTSYAATAAVMTPGNTYVFPWIATWRDNSLLAGGNQAGTVFHYNTRTSTECYMKGLKEKISLLQNDGSQWLWRRICFTFRGNFIYQYASSNGGVAYETSAGFGRLVNDVNNLSNPKNFVNSITSLIFKGANGVDWNNYFTAPTDNTRCTIRYDKTVSLATGNQNGYFRTVNRWHPMNKTLVYDDDETGGQLAAANASVAGKRGMGDYYVIDIFNCAAPAASSSTLQFAPEATLYWHEK